MVGKKGKFFIDGFDTVLPATLVYTFLTGNYDSKCKYVCGKL